MSTFVLILQVFWIIIFTWTFLTYYGNMWIDPMNIEYSKAHIKRYNQCIHLFFQRLQIIVYNNYSHLYIIIWHVMKKN
jgi:hypothetical protein